MRRPAVIVASVAAVLLTAALLSRPAALIALPLAAAMVTIVLARSGTRQLAWRLATAGSALWAVEEALWAVIRLTNAQPRLPLTDVAAYSGSALWLLALLLMAGRRWPSALSLPLLPALPLLLWIDTRHVQTTLAMRFPIVDVLLVLATLPALETALRGRASEGRLLWAFGFLVRALTAGTVSWLFGAPALRHWIFVLFLLPYLFVAIGASMELSDEDSGMWAAATTILGLEAVSAIMLTMLYRSGDAGQPAMLGVVLLLAYFQFVGIMLVLLSDRRRRIRAEQELKAWGEVIDRVVSVEPSEFGALGSVEAVVEALSVRLPNVNGAEIYAEGPIRAGDPQGYAFPLVTGGTEIGRLYFERHPRDTGVLDAVTPFLAGRIQQALDQATWRARAVTDPLTGLLNRRGVELRSGELLARAVDHKACVSVAMLDIDHFKRVNDFFDHATGDRALRETAGILQRHLRQHDVAARWGGEEFLVILYDADRDAANEVVARIRSELRAHPMRPVPWPLTVSVGLSGGSCPDGPHVLEAWISDADRALIRAKAAGRDRTEAAV